LLVAARGGNERALQRLFELCLGDLRRKISGLLGSRSKKGLTVDDVLEETAIHAIGSLSSLRATTYSGFRSWFAAIARNRIRVATRTALRRALPESRLSSDAVAALEHRGGLVRDEVLLRGVGRLSRNHRTAFVLREGLGLSWATIGFILGRRPAEAARQVHVRARARLFRIIETEFASRSVACPASTTP